MFAVLHAVLLWVPSALLPVGGALQQVAPVGSVWHQDWHPRLLFPGDILFILLRTGTLLLSCWVVGYLPVLVAWYGAHTLQFYRQMYLYMVTFMFAGAILLQLHPEWSMPRWQLRRLLVYIMVLGFGVR